jgi:hypothetical protein
MNKPLLPFIALGLAILPVGQSQAQPPAWPVPCADPRAIGCVAPAPVHLAQLRSLNPLSGSWTINGADGATVGTFEIDWAGNSSRTLRGELRVWLSMGGSMAMTGSLSVRRVTTEALDLAMRGNDGTEYRLLMPLPGPGTARVSGSFFDGDALRPVTMVRGGGPMAFDPGPAEDDFVSDEPEEFDMPGVGVSGPAYRLIGVPAGRRLAVRAAGERDAATVGTLSADATEILVIGCEPYMEAFEYEQLGSAGKRQVLDASWCEVRHDQASGHIPGRYLEAILR